METKTLSKTIWQSNTINPTSIYDFMFLVGMQEI